MMYSERVMVLLWVTSVTLGTCSILKPSMSSRSVLNENYSGVVEAFPVAAEVRERGGRREAVAGAVPIHTCTPEEVRKLANTTHHYCDIFTDELLAPLEELAYVRLDENYAEKVFINRSKRILLHSSDGQLAQWRCAPSFESANRFVAGTPIVNKLGALISVVTARRGNHYAVSAFEGEGGYFATPEPWRVVALAAARFVYGEREFASREAVRAHAAALAAAPAPAGPAAPRVLAPPAPAPARLALLAPGGLQLAHVYLQGVSADGVVYL